LRLIGFVIVWAALASLTAVAVAQSPEADPGAAMTRSRRPPVTGRAAAVPKFDESAKSAPAAADTQGRTLLAPVTKWVYNLRDVKQASVEACQADLAVIDYSPGSHKDAFTRQQLDAMRTKPGGKRMKLIAYMSIGEAEEYRDLYFRKEWLTGSRPSWLGALNPDWPGNFKVRYWQADWQRTIYGTPQSYLDQIIAAGFDGAYLDIVDAYAYWQEPESPDGGRKTAADEMVAFVSALAKHAWTKSPGFMIIPQNGEGLLRNASYRAHISAIGIESLYFRGIVPPRDEPRRDDVEPNREADLKERLASLDFAIADRIPVLTVEYLMDEPEDAAVAPAIGPVMRARGLVPHFSVRQLHKLYCGAPN
jgi:cysteinyl-tRNA synthetase, unknown class